MTAQAYRPIPLAQAGSAVTAKEKPPRLIIGDFLDDWRRADGPQSKAGLIAEPIEDSADPLCGRPGGISGGRRRVGCAQLGV